MSPREIIARALHRADVEPRRFDPHWNVHEWDDLGDPAKVYWWQLAEAVMRALESMRATAAMERVHDEIGCLSTTEVWQGLAGAMRDE